MSLRGRCPCGNFRIDWQTVDHSLVPRACQCDYCRGHDAAWVSKSGTRVSVHIASGSFHRVTRQGSGSAAFHECAGCDVVVCVTAEIDGDTYGALNAACIDNRAGFGTPVDKDFSGQGPSDKQARWRDNWCAPVSFHEAG